MINDSIVTAHIPAREGSKRLKEKNLQLLGGKPLISYAVNAGLSSRYIDHLYVNTESEKIVESVRSSGVKIYKRSSSLSQDHVTQDTFNYDFLKNIETDILVLLNPVCPLISAKDIDTLLEVFIKNNRDCLVTTSKYEMHALMDTSPVNFNINEIIKPTQEMPPIRLINWAVGIWNAKKFREYFETHGYAALFGNVEYYDLPKSRSVKINTQEDLDLAECLILLKKNEQPVT
jgi:N-acylneuraminate cytidylyltransferase/CMP-N,N'-diacetyllegionaminic acid synthase